MMLIKSIEDGCLVERGLRPQRTRAMIKFKKQINFFFFEDHRIQHSPSAWLALIVHYQFITQNKAAAFLCSVKMCFEKSLRQKEEFGELITYLSSNGPSECMTATSMTSISSTFTRTFQSLVQMSCSSFKWQLQTAVLFNWLHSEGSCSSASPLRYIRIHCEYPWKLLQKTNHAF